jgi:hypothetical protein
MIYMWFTGINYYKLAVEKDQRMRVDENSGLAVTDTLTLLLGIFLILAQQLV